MKIWRGEIILTGDGTEVWEDEIIDDKETLND